MNTSYDWSSQDLGNILHFEHININVPNQGTAAIFYFEGLGLTRDPFEKVGTTYTWTNVGNQQIHLTIATTAEVIAGHIGLVVPEIDVIKLKLKTVETKLKDTQFKWCEANTAHDDIEYLPPGQAPLKFLSVTGPWGNQFRIYENKTLKMIGDLGIPYLEVLCPVGTASKIVQFYKKYFGAIGTLEKQGSVGRIRVGPWQQIIYRETSETIAAYTGWHVAIYVTDFSSIYNKFLSENLIFHQTRFPDRYTNLEEALSWRQFRTCDFVDDGKVIFQLHHEVRSLYHPSYRRPLVNRMGNTGIFCCQ
eukprot:TRINITY_DN591_c0_g1_i1.p1 TRINITY_DN591_c0_g1~~TRINITY_DN591_c0_g1_i1.p1  ORF type:complete len:305 (+),score=49.33 TRINITY_DN591_c0_g1_i1:71-985(+)